MLRSLPLDIAGIFLFSLSTDLVIWAELFAISRFKAGEKGALGELIFEFIS